MLKQNSLRDIFVVRDLQIWAVQLAQEETTNANQCLEADSTWNKCGHALFRVLNLHLIVFIPTKCLCISIRLRNVH